MHLPNIVIMGVAGSGKTSVGRSLAETLHATFIEGDDFHPPANVERMAAGVALTDADRADWLSAIVARLAQGCAQSERMVLACSALKRSYRDRLRQGDPSLYFIHLQGTPEVLEQRLAQRTGHYMPVSLLASQLETLEPPGPDELSFTCETDAPPEVLAERILEHLQTTLTATSF